MSETDLTSNGFGFSWGHTRSYTNIAMSNGGSVANGLGWVIQDWPSLDESIYQVPTAAGSSSSSVEVETYTAVDVIWGSDNGLTFIEVMDSPVKIYQSMFGDPDVLTHDAATNEYTLRDRAGNKSVFNDFDVANGRGQVKRLESVGQTAIDFQYNTTNQLTKMQRSNGALTESFDYVYFTAGPNAGFIDSVTHNRGGASIRKAEYTYYVDGDPHGNDGLLKTATILQFNGSTWDELSTQYYRYYTTGIASEDGKMRFALSPEAFQKLSDDPSVSDPFTAPDSTVAQYADFKFEYDDHGRVDREWVRAGSMEFTYAYSTSTNDIAPNSWTNKTVMTKPDGSTETQYMNYAGSTILRVLADGADEWCHFQHYDTDNKVILEADAAAISGYSESLPDLLGYDETTGTYTHLKNSEGLIRLTSYTDEDYVFEESIKEGQNGAEILVSRSTYLEHKPDPNGESIFLIQDAITFPDAADPSRTITTTYSYNFFSTTPIEDPLNMKVSSRTTTLPVIPTDQNGSGVANSTTETIDKYDDVTELTNEEGIKTKWTYDNETGGITQQIQDVGDSTHFNLTTNYELDNQGRTTQELGPAHEIQIVDTMVEIRTATWTVYDDSGHQLRAGAGYRRTDTNADTLINPVSITQLDKNGNVLESIQAARASTSGKLLPTDTFPQSSYTRWSTTQYTECCMAASQRVYHNIPASGPGSSGSNYDQTNFGYDSMDRRNRVVTPGGTITATVFDVRDLPVQIYVGTNDDGGTENDPTGGGTDPANNMVVITTNEYDDNQDGGNNNLTQQTSHVDSSSSNDRVVKYEYDFRNRLSQTETTDGSTTWFDVPDYDNLNRVTASRRYHSSVDPGNLIQKQESVYDDLGRAFRTYRYGVNPTTGVINLNKLTSNLWFTKTGRTMKSAPSGTMLFAKLRYDNVGRLYQQFVGYGDGNTYADAGSIVGDTILEQLEAVHDKSGYVVESLVYQRTHNGSGTGALTSANSRVMYSYAWQDGIGRSIAAANYGTNGGAPPTARNAIPFRSDTIHVTTTQYDDDTGEVEATIDPADTETRLQFDDAGRQLKLIQNYIDGQLADDANITTQKTYNADGNVSTLTAWNADTGNQVTTYEYGTTLFESTIASSLLIAKIMYPDSSDPSDSIQVTHNRQSQTTKHINQLGTVHQYSYDQLGRLIADAVTTAGTGVEPSVLRLSWSYDILGLIKTATSHDAATGGSVVNQVQWAYNDFGQMTTSFQEHSGAVNPATTPTVQYTYADGSSNTLRPTGMTYPNGRIIVYDYGVSGGMNDKVSRVAAIKDGPTSLAAYVYLGLGAVVQVDYTEPGVQYDLIGISGYAGLDQFDRIIDSRWKTPSADLDRIEYGYDRASNRTYRRVPTDTSNKFDELYSHDGMYRLTDMKRGQLDGSNAVMTSIDFEQTWTLDETGNWSGFKQDDNGDGTWNLEQSRVSNKANEIININNTAGAPWVTPKYDKAGNVTRMPTSSSNSFSWNELTIDDWYDLTVDEWYGLASTTGDEPAYDAWNRLVRVTSSGSDFVTYNYDAQHRRIQYSGGSMSADAHYYYSARWQLLLESTDDGAAEYVWGVRYVDDLILRDRDTDGDTTLDERLYAMLDANWNITAICSKTGNVEERYAYHGYGLPSFLTDSYGNKNESDYSWTTLFSGYKWDEQAELYHVRNRSFSPELGTWLQRDPLGYMDHPSLYDLLSSSPVSHVDPSGLLDCKCKAKAKELSGSLRNEINDIVNDWLVLTYPRDFSKTNAPPIPPDQLTSDELARWRCAFWLIAASDHPKPYANIGWPVLDPISIPVTRIEQEIHGLIGTSPAISLGGFKNPGGFGTLADCIRIECDGKVYTIGSDKIGHMMQQGHMGYEIEMQSPNPRFAKAFSQWTEGLPISPAVPGFREWLLTGEIDFFGRPECATSINTMREEWGGRVGMPAGIGIFDLAQRSPADVNANLVGTQFWKDLGSGMFGDSAGFYAPGNVGPVDAPNFDICRYLKIAGNLEE